ncbi:MAG: SDR family NAD(P)-dependent oxidoreductase [Bradymonadaceae bacterium]|nr:SDR family NAD(P)-dependent oxidoreductase [Lujinxingiaceae bacterium]
MNNEPKRVVVTGAAGALGREVVKQFLEAGCRVVGVDINTASQSGGLVADGELEALSWLRADLTQAAAVKEAIALIEQDLGGIDTLVHCAGGFRYLQIEEAGDADIDFLIDLNLRSSLFVLREVLGGMKARNYGRIMLISSKSTLKPSAGEGPYAATKAALNALVSASAEEIKAFDININALLPSIIDTAANREAMPGGEFARWVAPDALARIIVALSGPLGDPIHGALIPVSARM